MQVRNWQKQQQNRIKTVYKKKNTHTIRKSQIMYENSIFREKKSKILKFKLKSHDFLRISIAKNYLNTLNFTAKKS